MKANAPYRCLITAVVLAMNTMMFTGITKAFDVDALRQNAADQKAAAAATHALTDTHAAALNDTKAIATRTTTATANLPPRPVPVDKGVSSGTRDPWLWPFARNSIWNMPIGSHAVYVPAGLQAPGSGIGVDHERFYKTTASDPEMPCYHPYRWNQRWPANGDFNLVTYRGKLYFPADAVIPDAKSGSTPNECAAVLQPDGDTLIQLEPLCRPYAKVNKLIGYWWCSPQGNPHLSLKGEGAGGSHFGSGLSALGGSIRLGELTGSDPIRHAIKLNLFAHKYCYFDHSTKQGYRWPATGNDSYADGNYGGTNQSLRMGSLLAIWPGYTDPSQLGITTEVGKKLFYALRDYGAYVPDDAAWDHYDLCVENGVPAEVQNKYGMDLSHASGAYYNDMVILIKNLYVIDNNSPASIGGGGTPCQPLAPAFP